LRDRQSPLHTSADAFDCKHSATWAFVARCGCRLPEDDDTSDAAVFGMSRGMRLLIDKNVTYLLLLKVKSNFTFD